MKLRLMIAAMAAGTALFATEDVNSYIYGVLAVTNDTASSYTVVGVPWRDVTESVDMTNVTLSDLISTQNVDTVYLYSESTTATNWYAYTVSDGVLKPTTTVSGFSNLTQGEAANVLRLARGTGLIVQRASNTNPIYLCGRYDSSPPAAVTIPAATIRDGKTIGTKVLIANPKTETVYITAGNVGDMIQIPDNDGKMKIYNKKSDGWYETTPVESFEFPMKSKTKCANGVPLDAGRGAFYVNKGSSFELTF